MPSLSSLYDLVFVIGIYRMNKLIDSLSNSVAMTSISLPQSLWTGRCYWTCSTNKLMGSLSLILAMKCVALLLISLWIYFGIGSCSTYKLIGSQSTSLAMTSDALTLISLWSSFCYWDLQDEQVDWLPVKFCSNDQYFPPSIFVVWSLLLGLAVRTSWWAPCHLF